MDQADLFRSNHPLWFVAMMYLSFLTNTIFILPLYSPLNLIFAFIIDDFVTGSILLSVLPILVTITMYLSISNKVIPYLRSKLSRFESFKHLDHNIDASSYSICFVIRFLYIPVGIKEYSLLVLRYPFKANLLSAVVYYTIHGIIFAGVGSQLHNINEMFKKQYWSNMTVEEKVDLLLVLVSVVFTVSTFLYITYWMRNKVMADNNIDLSSVREEDDYDSENDERERLVQ